MIIRYLIRLIGRCLLLIFTQPVIKGKEHLPKKGAMILAGNHVGVMEVVMMAVYAPRAVEFIGTGDIPLDPNYAWLGNLYGLIAIKRGSIDRSGLQKALSVLKQNGVLGIFPEGGIWQPSAMQAQIGVAWLSQESQTPVIPIGFSGVTGALGKVIHLRRPRIEMNIGEAVSPLIFDQKNANKKEQLQAHANLILEKIRALTHQPTDQHNKNQKELVYNLEINLFCEKGQSVPIPEVYRIKDPALLALFLDQPVLLDTFLRNLKLPVKSLQNSQNKQSASAIETACQSILNYLNQNPGFFTYRFGMEKGLAMQNSIRELHILSKMAAERNCKIEIKYRTT